MDQEMSLQCLRQREGERDLRDNIMYYIHNMKIIHYWLMIPFCYKIIHNIFLPLCVIWSCPGLTSCVVAYKIYTIYILGSQFPTWNACAAGEHYNIKWFSSIKKWVLLLLRDNISLPLCSAAREHNASGQERAIAKNQAHWFWPCPQDWSRSWIQKHLWNSWVCG